jgi:predicted PurR-regulated permease PerM
VLDPRDYSLNQLYRWLLIALLFPLFFLNGWLVTQVLQYFQPLVTTFVVAILLSFLLNYPVQFLQKRGLQRGLSVLLVVLIAFAIFAALGVTLIPLLLEDVGEVIQLLPQWFDSGRAQLQSFQAWAITRGLPIDVSRIIDQLSNRFPDQLQSFSDEALGLALGAIGNVSEALLVAILTFYLLLDAERLSKGFFQLLPTSLGSDVKRSLEQNFENYIIGQLTLASITGTTQTIALLLLNVPYALLFGLVIGVLAIIPFGDAIGFGLIGLVLTAQDFWLGIKVLVVAIVIDQIIDQIVAPRLLGRFTGLRPIWVLTALLVGTRIGGVLGLVLAVPLTSFVKSLIDDFKLLKAAEDNPLTTVTLPAGDRPEESSPLSVQEAGKV